MPDLNTLWNEAEPEPDTTNSGHKLPDGIYDCTLKDVGIIESKKGNMGVAWNFTDNASGASEFKWSRLRFQAAEDFRDDAGWLKRDMAAIGLACDSFDEVDSTLKTMIGATIRIEISTKKTKDSEWRNIKIIEKIADPPEQSQWDTQADDVPF